MLATDTFGRPLGSLRISVTDRCNLRCHYCMPEKDYIWLPRKDILTFEEVDKITSIFSELGVNRLRITGGEPLLRQNLSELIKLLSANNAIHDIALTTNGTLLKEKARELHQAGLSRVTISLDTLKAERFRNLSRVDAHHATLEGIAEATVTGFNSVKINTVVIRDVNDDELIDLLEYSKQIGAEIRFIEYMDVGGATRWSIDKVISKDNILHTLEAYYGTITPINEDTSMPADRFVLPDGKKFGIIASTTEPFCRNCDRSRLTADGLWYLCLYSPRGIDLRRLLRSGASSEDLRSLITSTWRNRSDRGAEIQLASNHHTPLISIKKLQKDPHLEMHTRGG